MADDKLILSLLQEVRTEQTSHTKSLINLENDVRQNTEDLYTHMEGVRQNRKRIENLEKTEIKINASKDFYNKVRTKLLTISKIISTIGAVIGLVYSWINNLFSSIYNFFF